MEGGGPSQPPLRGQPSGTSQPWKQRVCARRQAVRRDEGVLGPRPGITRVPGGVMAGSPAFPHPAPACRMSSKHVGQALEAGECPLTPCAMFVPHLLS